MGPKPPKVQPLPPPPPPPPAEDAAAAATAQAELEAVARRQRGRAATLLTGGLGVSGQASVQKPTLLGS